MPRDRKYPGDSIQNCATLRKWYEKRFSSTEKTAVYWPEAADSVTIVGYYDTVSEANAAALAEQTDSGARPNVAVNFWHGDWSRTSVGAMSHRVSTDDLPAWYDEDPE